MAKSFDDNIGWDLSKDMQAICKPLKHSLNIDYITYARYFNNGRYSILFTDGNAVSNCFKHPDYQLPGFVLNSGIYHWQDLYSPALLTDLRDAFGHDHGVTFIREYDHFTEHLTFSQPSETTALARERTDYMQVLQEAGFYFKEQAESIITLAEKHAQPITSSEPTEPNTPPEPELPSAKQFPLHGAQGDVLLSAREFTCLLFTLQLKSAREIGEMIHLSPRTVEWHLDNVKQKLGVTEKSQLFELAKKNHLHW